MSKDRNEKKKALFEMILKASPFAGFVFHPERDGSEADNGASEEWIERPNIKMQALREQISMDSFNEIINSSIKYNHPAVFPFKALDEHFFAVFMPLIEGPEENIRICFLVNNPTRASFEAPLLRESAWHELNNPLTVISLSLQKAIKKETLNQEDIDNILDKINTTFLRIEAFILGQILVD